MPFKNEKLGISFLWLDIFYNKNNDILKIPSIFIFYTVEVILGRKLHKDIVMLIIRDNESILFTIYIYTMMCAV